MSEADLRARILELEAAQERMHSFLEAHDLLTRMVLDGHGLKAITAKLSSLVQHSVEVEDYFHNLLASYTYQNCDDVFHNARKSGDYSLQSQMIQSLEKDFEQVRQTRRAVVTQADRENGLERDRLISPIMVENELLGYVILLERRGKFSQRVIQACEHAALIYALLMMKEKSEFEAEQRLQADFIEDLISDSPKRNLENLIKRSRYFGFNPTADYLLLIARVEQPEWDAGIMRQLYEELNRRLKDISEKPLFSMKNNEIILLVPLNLQTEQIKIVAAIQHAIDRLRLTTGVITSVVNGGICNQFDDFPVLAKKAYDCLDLLSALERQGEIVSYEQFGLYSILLERQNKQVLFEFAAGYLQKLNHYDTKHKTNLVETLRIYFANGTKLKETAKDCHIHLSALKYRLKRIAEIGNFNLTDPEVSFNLQLALKIQALERKKR